MDLQTAALLVATGKPELRDQLDVLDFQGQAAKVAQALKDGRSDQGRRVMQDWLRGLGVLWDGKSDIGEAILQSLHLQQELERARAKARLIEQRLRYPHIAGVVAVQDTIRKLKEL